MPGSAAEGSYREVIASGAPEEASRAAVRLALLLSDEGRYAEAEDLFWQALDNGGPRVALDGALGLGRLLLDAGRLIEAESIYRRGVACLPEVLTIK